MELAILIIVCVVLLNQFLGMVMRYYTGVGIVSDIKDIDYKYSRIESKLDKLLKDKEDVVYMCPGPHDWMSMGIDDKIEYFGCRRPKCMASKKVAKDKENGDAPTP